MGRWGEACASALAQGSHPPRAVSCPRAAGAASWCRQHLQPAPHQAAGTACFMLAEAKAGLSPPRASNAPASGAAIPSEAGRQGWHSASEGHELEAALLLTTQLLPMPLRARMLRIALDGQEQIKALEELYTPDCLLGTSDPSPCASPAAPAPRAAFRSPPRAEPQGAEVVVPVVPKNPCVPGRHSLRAQREESVRPQPTAPRQIEGQSP